VEEEDDFPPFFLSAPQKIMEKKWMICGATTKY
jgi:hypothetical protein